MAKNHDKKAKENVKKSKKSSPAEEIRNQAGPEPDSAATARVEQLQAELQEANDKYMRSRAELENYRKRMQREMAEIRHYTKASTIEEFLPVFDHFQMAMDHMGQQPDVKTMSQGMKMILGEFKKTLETLGVQPIEAQGQTFDPNQHEAVAQEPELEIPAGTVVRQWMCGYRLGERLLRPATVVVSSGPPEKTDPTETTPNQDPDSEEK